MNYKFPGRTVRERNSGLFRLTETSYSPRASLPTHTHETAYVSFLMAGSYEESCGTRQTNCSPGTVMWHPPYDAHADRFASDGGHMINLEMSGSWFDEAAQELKPHPEIRAFNGGLPYSLGLRLYRELHANTGAVDDLALELASFFFTGKADRHPPVWFARALDLLQETYDRPLSLTGAAREVGVHPVHLARCFRRFLGCTFGDHLAKLRLRKAFSLLLTTNHSIAEVAHASGFADHAHLSRSFKQSTGLTPSAFRRNVSAG